MIVGSGKFRYRVNADWAQLPEGCKLIGRFGETPAGTEPGRFLAPHGLAVDSLGDVYVGEVSWTAWPQIYPGEPHPADLRSLQKFERVD